MKLVSVICASVIFFLVLIAPLLVHKGVRHGDWVVVWNDGSETRIAEPLLDDNFSQVIKGGKECIKRGTSAILVNDGRDISKLKVKAVKRLRTNTPPLGTSEMIYEVCPDYTDFKIQ